MAARVTVTLKLQPGVDDDLILWWQSGMPGKRHKLLKHILRSYVEGVAKGETEQQQLSRITADLASVRVILAALSAHLSHPIIIQTPSEKLTPPDSLTVEGVKRREKRIARSTW